MIVESHPVQDGSFRLVSRGEFMSPHACHLQVLKEFSVGALWRVRNGAALVPAVALAAHGRSNAPGRKRILEIMTAILAASVTVKD